MNAEELKFMRITAEYSEDCGAVMKVDPTAILCLINKISATERERDELREQFDKLASAAGWSKEQCEQVGESPFDTVEGLKNAVMDHHHSLIKAEKELKRRDAAAGEPVAVLYRNGDVLTKAECGEYFEICCKVEIPLYTAAPPAVLPDIDGYTHGLFPHAVEQLTRFRDDALALGAQQQKVVELPAASVPHGWKLVPLKAFPSQWAAGQKAFDAAGINKIDSVYHAMVEAAPAPGGDGG